MKKTYSRSSFIRNFSVFVWLSIGAAFDWDWKWKFSLKFFYVHLSIWNVIKHLRVQNFTQLCVCVIYTYIFFTAQQAPVCQGLPIIEASISHSRHPTLGRTSLDERSARRRDLSPWQHPTLKTDRHQCRRRDSNPQTQQPEAADTRLRPRGH